MKILKGFCVSSRHQKHVPCVWHIQPTSHYNDVTMGSVASQITSLTIVYAAVYRGEDQRKHQSSASLAFVRGIHRGPVISPHKWPVTRKMFPCDDVIMASVMCFIPRVSPWIRALIARFMGPTWGRSEADRAQVGPMLASWTLLSGWA